MFCRSIQIYICILWTNTMIICWNIKKNWTSCSFSYAVSLYRLEATIPYTHHLKKNIISMWSPRLIFTYKNVRSTCQTGSRFTLNLIDFAKWPRRVQHVPDSPTFGVISQRGQHVASTWWIPGHVRTRLERGGHVANTNLCCLGWRPMATFIDRSCRPPVTSKTTFSDVLLHRKSKNRLLVDILDIHVKHSDRHMATCGDFSRPSFATYGDFYRPFLSTDIRENDFRVILWFLSIPTCMNSLKLIIFLNQI